MTIQFVSYSHIKLVFFLPIYVLGYRFRMLVVILVSDYIFSIMD